MRFRLLLLMIVVGTASRCWGGPDTTLIGTVNGERIVRAELAFALADYRGALAAAAGRNRGVLSDSAREIIDRILNDVIDAKLQLILAVRENLLAGASYRQFESDWRRENAERRALKDKGGIVYGPVEFSEPAFYHYRLSQVALRLKEVLGGSALTVTDEELRSGYDSLATILFSRPDSLLLLVITLNTADLDTLNLVRHSMEQGVEPQALLERFPCAVRLDTIDEDRSRLLSEDHPEYLRAACSLRDGGISAWLQGQGQHTLLKCLGRRPASPRPYTEVEGLLRSRFVEARYREYLRGMRAGAQIEIDHAAVEQVINELHETGR